MDDIILTIVFTPALVRCEIMQLFNEAVSNMCICSFRRLRHFPVLSSTDRRYLYPSFTTVYLVRISCVLYAIVLVFILSSVLVSSFSV